MLNDICFLTEEKIKRPNATEVTIEFAMERDRTQFRKSWS